MVAMEATVGLSLATKQRRRSVKVNIRFRITLAGTPGLMVQVVEMVREDRDRRTLVAQEVESSG